MKKLIISLGIFISCMSFFTAVASTSSTADIAPQPIAVSIVSTGMQAEEQSNGINIAVIIPGNLQKPDIQEFVYLAGIYPFLLDPENKVCILLPLTALKAMCDNVSGEFYQEIEIIKSVENYVNTIPLSETPINECTSKIIEMMQDNYGDILLEKGSIDFRVCRNKSIACTLVQKAIFEERKYIVYSINDQFVLLVPNNLTQSDNNGHISKRLRISVPLTLVSKGINVSNMNEITEVSDLEFSARKPSNELLVEDFMPDALDKLLLKRENNTSLCKIIFYGHGTFSKDNVGKDKLVGIYQNKFIELLKFLNGKAVDAVGYKTCYTGEQIKPIEELDLLYSLTAIVDSGVVYVKNELNIYFPLNVDEITNLLRVKDQKFELCPRDRAFLRNMFANLEFAKLSTDLQIGGIKAPGEKKFIPQGRNITPLKIPSAFTTRMLTDKIVYPAQQYVVDALECSGVTFKSKYPVQIYKYIKNKDALIKYIRNFRSLDHVVFIEYLENNEPAELAHLNSMRNVIIFKPVDAHVPHFFYQTDGDEPRTFKKRLSRACSKNERILYENLLKTACREKLTRPEIGAKRKLQFSVTE